MFRNIVLIFNLVVLVWPSLPFCNALSVLLNASSTEQFLQSPGYPTSYEVDMQIRWNISGPVGSQILFTFLGGNIENCCDYVELIDGTATSLGKFTGSNVIWKSRMSSNNSLQVFFSSDQTIALNGFRASYKAVTCGDNLRASKSPQSLSTPGWPSGYSTMQNCYWIIYSDNEKVDLTLRSGETDGEGYVYVEIFDGNKSLAIRSGEIHEQTFSSTTNQFLIHFYTEDDNRNRSGVFMEYRLASCLFSFAANESISFISTPLFPAPYADNSDCRWTISATAGKRIFIQFLEGSTESCCDIIKIKDPLTVARKLSGIITPGSSFISSGRELIIEFSSDNSDAGSGFNASYREVDCGANFKVTPKKQRFEYNGQGTDCFWIFSGDKNKQIQLKLSGRIEGSAYIEVFDGDENLGRRNGKNNPEVFVSSHGFLIVHYYRNGSREHASFIGRFKENCGSVIKASSTPTVIQIPCDDLDCTWRFTPPSLRNVSLTLSHADLRRCNKTLKIHQGQKNIKALRNSDDLTYHSAFGSLSMTLRGRGTTSMKKLNISVGLEKCGRTLVADYSPTYLTTPGWPNAYGNNFNCEWVIKTTSKNQVHLKFKEVDLERCCDFIEVFEGNHSLGKSGNINSSLNFASSKGGSLRVVFVSDPAVVGKGFRAKYFIKDFCGSTVRVKSTNNTQFLMQRLNYNKELDCKASFEAAEGFQIWMLLNTSSQCCGYAKVYDGTKLLSTLKSNKTNQLFVSRTGRLDIILHLSANSGFTVIGFYRKFGCYKDLKVEATNKTLSLASFSVNSLYPNNLDCRWRLQAPANHQILVIVHQIDIESCCDMLRLRRLTTGKKGNLTLFGKSRKIQTYFSKENTVIIVFRSDQSITQEGFRLTYKLET